MEVPGEAPPAQGGFGGDALAPPQQASLETRSAAIGRHYSSAGVLFAAVAIGVAVSVATGSAQAFSRYGISFVWSGTFSPRHRRVRGWRPGHRDSC